MTYLVRKKYEVVGQESNRIHRVMGDGDWINSITDIRNGTELSQEAFRDNLCFRYVLMIHDIPATCDSYGNKFSVYHALSSPQGCLIIYIHEGVSKVWGALSDQDLNPSEISY